MNPPAPKRQSLAETVVAILGRVQVPVETAAIRAIASLLRAEEVGAERLGRVASHEREAFLRSRTTPRLASSLRSDGTAINPRVWCRGEWLLPLRIITEDAEEARLATICAYLCALAIEREAENVGLAPIAHEIAARVIGDLAFEPETLSGWESLRGAVAAVPMGPGVTTPTVHQKEAAETLTRVGLSEYSLYFGLEESAGILSNRAPKEVRLALPHERGIAFDDFVRERVDDEASARDLLAYIEAFGHFYDKEGQEPTTNDYAAYWHVDPKEAQAQRRLFEQIFPAETGPLAIWTMLWDGVGQRPKTMTRLLGVVVVRSAGHPTVISHFINCIADELRVADPGAPLQVPAVMEESPSTPDGEIRRFYALCARATEVWCNAALAAAGDEPSLLGLRSLEPVSEERTAAYTEAMLGRYRNAERGSSAGPVLLATQKALRVAASLRRLDPPLTTIPYLDGIRWAAKALVAARADIGEDLSDEIERTVLRLDAVY